MTVEAIKIGNEEVIIGPTWNPKLPSIYQIEAFSRCNLSCPFCLTGIEQAPFRYEDCCMDMDLFKTIVDRDLGGSRFIELQFRGEPTLNKNLLKMVELLKQEVYVGFSTHGGTLHSDHAMQAALESHYITISIDAGSEESYKKKRVGGNWLRLISNITLLIRKRGVNQFPIISLQLIENGDDWEQELDKLYKLADELAWSDEINIRTIHNTALSWENPKIKVRNDELCLNPWLSVSIKMNGDVVPCCMAFKDEEAMCYGNLKEHSLKEIWNSAKVQEFRYRHLVSATGCKTPSTRVPATCQSCYSKSPALLHDRLIMDAISNATRPHLF